MSSPFLLRFDLFLLFILHGNLVLSICVQERWLVLSELVATAASLNRVSTVLLGLLLCSFLGASQLPVVFRGSGVEKGDSFWNRMGVPKPRNKFCLLFTKIQIGFLELSKSKVTGLEVL